MITTTKKKIEFRKQAKILQRNTNVLFHWIELEGIPVNIVKTKQCFKMGTSFQVGTYFFLALIT